MVIISPPRDQTYLGTNTQIELSDILALHNELNVVSSTTSSRQVKHSTPLGFTSGVHCTQASGLSCGGTKLRNEI